MKGKLRWGVCMYYEGTAVQIVPTPELQPWTEWDGKDADASDDSDDGDD